MKNLVRLLTDAFKEFSEHHANMLAAAVAYFAIFSIGPILLIAIAIAGFVLGQDAAQGQIKQALAGQVGEAGAEVVEGMISAASKGGAGLIATIIGLVTLILGAMGLFSNIRKALNIIWEVPEPKGGGIGAAVMRNVGLFFMLVLVGVLLIAAVASSSILAAAKDFVGDWLPGAPIIWQILAQVVSFGLLVLLFAMVYKILPETEIAWKDVWVGAAITAALFVLGQIAISFYLGLSDPGSPYGAAGALVVLIVWIFYSGLIFFFGAAITRSYARLFGSRMTTEDRRRQEAEQARKAGAEPAPAGPANRASPWFSKS
jgi:membrane protein